MNNVSDRWDELLSVNEWKNDKKKQIMKIENKEFLWLVIKNDVKLFFKKEKINK